MKKNQTILRTYCVQNYSIKKGGKKRRKCTQCVERRREESNYVVLLWFSKTVI